MSDRYGRDARWILKRELEYHRYLASVPGIPRADEYFEVGGDGYLVIDHVDGQSIEAFVSKTLGRRQWAVVEQTTRLRVLKTLVSFLELVAVLHDRGFVHRDLSNANVWVTRDDTTALLDLEMGHIVGDKEPPVGAGTPGFVSPQQAEGSPPTLSMMYSASCIAILVLTGIDPRRVLFASCVSRSDQLSELTGHAQNSARFWRLSLAGWTQMQRIDRPLDRSKLPPRQRSPT